MSAWREGLGVGDGRGGGRGGFVSTETCAGGEGLGRETGDGVAVESAGGWGGHGVGCERGRGGGADGVFTVERGLWGGVGGRCAGVRGSAGCAPTERSVGSSVVLHCLLPLVESLGFPAQFFLAITDGGIHFCFESRAVLWEEIVCEIELFHVHRRGTLTRAHGLRYTTVRVGSGSACGGSRELVDDLLVDHRTASTVVIIGVIEVSVVVEVVLGARPGFLRVLVVCNRLWADVDDMMDVGNFEGMLASVDWAGTAIRCVRVVRVAQGHRPGVAKLRVPARLRACRSPERGENSNN